LKTTNIPFYQDLEDLEKVFLDTLYEVFNGNKELFEGFYIYNKYNFEEYLLLKLIGQVMRLEI